MLALALGRDSFSSRRDPMGLAGSDEQLDCLGRDFNFIAGIGTLHPRGGIHLTTKEFEASVLAPEKLVYCVARREKASQQCRVQG
jgi:hypothetical protein